MNKIKLVFLLIISSTLIYCQGNGILPAQINAIQTLASDKGFSDEALNTFASIGILFYLLMYTFMNLSAFYMVVYASNQLNAETIDDWNGSWMLSEK